MPDVNIGSNTRIQRAIIDRGCSIPENTVIGENHEDDRQRGFRVTDKGIVLVTPDMLNQSTHSIR
jgi:glucose-1-phosphate adenylyltransferase